MTNQIKPGQWWHESGNLFQILEKTPNGTWIVGFRGPDRQAEFYEGYISTKCVLLRGRFFDALPKPTQTQESEFQELPRGTVPTTGMYVDWDKQKRELLYCGTEKFQIDLGAVFDIVHRDHIFRSGIPLYKRRLPRSVMVEVVGSTAGRLDTNSPFQLFPDWLTEGNRPKRVTITEVL